MGMPILQIRKLSLERDTPRDRQSVARSDSPSPNPRFGVAPIPCPVSPRLPSGKGKGFLEKPGVGAGVESGGLWGEYCPLELDEPHTPPSSPDLPVCLGGGGGCALLGWLFPFKVALYLHINQIST